MKEQKKKRIVASLLLGLCITAGYLFMISSQAVTGLESLAQADSLIFNELQRFNISDEQIRTTTIEVDSNLRRKRYQVRIPPTLSQTQIHTELNKTLYPYDINTPAKVTFPEKDVDIHVTYGGTVIRTISFETDLSVNINRHRASILIYFDTFPSQKLIEKIESMGDPIPIVMTVENPMEVNEITDELGSEYSRLLFWLQDSQGEDLVNKEPSSALTQLRQIHDVRPHATMAIFRSDKKTIPSFSDLDLNYVEIQEGEILSESHGEHLFKEHLFELETKPPHPMVIIQGSEATLEWLKEILPELKKNGVYLVAPPENNF